MQRPFCLGGSQHGSNAHPSRPLSLSTHTHLHEQTDASLLERPSPRIRPFRVSLSATLWMPRPSVILRMPLPTKNTSSPSCTLKCTTVWRLLSISVSSVDDRRRIARFALHHHDLGLLANKNIKLVPTE